MNFQRGKKHEDLEMNLVPLIDVLLVIIIFLVVSTTFSRVSCRSTCLLQRQHHQSKSR